MHKFIKLKSIHGSEVFVREDKIASMTRLDSTARTVVDTGDRYFEVEETPEKILESLGFSKESSNV